MKGDLALRIKLQEVAGLAQSEQEIAAIRSYAVEEMGIGEKELSTFEPKFLMLLLKRAQIRADGDCLPLWEEKVRDLHVGEDFWRPKELKCFLWVSVCLAFLSHRSLAHFVLLLIARIANSSMFYLCSSRPRLPSFSSSISNPSSHS